MDDAKVLVTTPVGEAKYPKINRPDKAEYGGDYKCRLVLPVEKVKELVKAIQQVALDNYPVAKVRGKDGKISKAVKFPYTVVTDEETGEKTVEILARSKYKPMVTDSRGNPVEGEVKVGGGSRVRLAIVLTPFSAKSEKIGVKAYLKEVQIVRLVEYKSAGAGSSVMGAVDADELDGEEGFDGSSYTTSVDEEAGAETYRGGDDDELDEAPARPAARAQGGKARTVTREAQSDAADEVDPLDM